VIDRHNRNISVPTAIEKMEERDTVTAAGDRNAQLASGAAQHGSVKKILLFTARRHV